MDPDQRAVMGTHWRAYGSLRWALMVSVVLLLAANDGVAAESRVALRAPMTTVWTFPGHVPVDGLAASATVLVPPDAPRDLGVGLWVADRHGRWYQRQGPRLHAGANTISIAIDAQDPGQADGHDALWNPSDAAISTQAGFYFWSATPSRVELGVSDLTLAAVAAAPSPQALHDLVIGNLQADAVAHLHTGERWSLSVCPSPFPLNPYDQEEFSLALVLSDAAGARTRIEGFYQQPMRTRDAGDHEQVVPAAGADFSLRVRPQHPGTFQARLEARWHGGPVVAMALPPLVVSGADWDQYVRVDPADHRFFSVDGRWWYPRGPNLRSVYDRRCQQYLGSALTPDRGLAAYHAYFERLGAAGVTCVEVWMCSWNLALEWRADWNGYQGSGRYNEANAWKLDQLLDDAWAHGIRVNLVVDNHGKASVATDHEWENNPANRACGGFLDDASAVFSDPHALALQDQLRRYLVARYADHPALMAWKLWSEINLTAASDQPRLLEHWHQQALARWHALDPYHHPCTTHWAGNYRTVDHVLASLVDLDVLCIDAYHIPPGQEQGLDLAQLLLNSVGSGERRGDLARLGKPVYVTEYGGNWDACSEPQLQAEHASGAFLALVDGHAGAPMLWWFEWLDQGARFAPYQAIAAFTSSEDLRDPRGASVALTASSTSGELWARAWSRPGRLLGYLLDRRWGAQGGAAPIHSGSMVSSGQPITAGTLRVEWWDADRGLALSSEAIAHAGGTLVLHPPDFSRHLAFKLYRER